MRSRLNSLLFWMMLAVLGILTGEIACTQAGSGSGTPSGAPSMDEAKKFLDDANATLLKLSNAANQAGWVYETYITDDTLAISAKAAQEYADAQSKFAKQATRFDKLDLPADLRREMTVLKTAL